VQQPQEGQGNDKSCQHRSRIGGTRTRELPRLRDLAAGHVKRHPPPPMPCLQPHAQTGTEGPRAGEEAGVVKLRDDDRRFLLLVRYVVGVNFKAGAAIVM